MPDTRDHLLNAASVSNTRLRALEKGQDNLMAFRTKMMWALLGVALLAGVVVGESRFAVAENGRDIIKNGTHIERAMERQADIRERVVRIEKDVEYIREEQNSQRDLLERIEQNTRPR